MRAGGEKQCESFLIAGFSHGLHARGTTQYTTARFSCGRG